MRERKRTFKPRPITVRLFTIKDKKRLISMPRPDMHFVEISSGNVIIGTWDYTNEQWAREHYESAIMAFA